jgi:hypothetical protein
VGTIGANSLGNTVADSTDMAVETATEGSFSTLLMTSAKVIIKAATVKEAITFSIGLFSSFSSERGLWTFFSISSEGFASTLYLEAIQEIVGKYSNPNILSTARATPIAVDDTFEEQRIRIIISIFLLCFAISAVIYSPEMLPQQT